MKKITSISCVALILAASAHASSYNIDVYGVDDETGGKIINCCAEKIGRYEDLKEELLIKQSKATYDEQLTVKHMHDEIIDEIKKLCDAKFIELSTISYSGKAGRYTTVDIVRKDETFRIPKAPERKSVKNLSIHPKLNALFVLWNDYNNKNTVLFNSGKLQTNTKKCPVSHCTWGFDDNEIKKYYRVLHEQSKKYELDLQNIILHDSDEQRRGDAIFILANADNYTTAVNFLFEFLDDESNLVRNNAMRVIAAILSKHKINTPPLNKIVEALNYPYVTDRNKAAYLLLSVSRNDASVHDKIIKEAGDTLIKLLKLKQPNNHDFSYHILRTISHKKYADTDINSWATWVKNRKST